MKTATAMTSNVRSPANARDLPGGSAEGRLRSGRARHRCRDNKVLHFECFLTAVHSGLSH